MRILLDMDGVTVDLYPTWLGLINRYYGETLKLEDLTEWDFAKFCKNATPDQVYGFLREPGFFRHLPIMPGAFWGVDALLKLGHEVVFVTSCTHGHSDKRAWIKNHFPDFNMRNIIFAERKELVMGDVLIDDNMDNLKNWFKSNPKGMPICFSQPHNKSYPLYRVNTWNQVVSLVVDCSDKRSLVDESEKITLPKPEKLDNGKVKRVCPDCLGEFVADSLAVKICAACKWAHKKGAKNGK